jgi:hypothetical protein
MESAKCPGAPVDSPGAAIATTSCMADEPKPTETNGGAYVLPRHLRFAQTLALVSGAAIGIAAGAAVISTGGCIPVAGIAYAPGVRVMSTDAADVAPADAIVDAGTGDDASDTGGGPRPAPLLPLAWIG